MKNLFKHIKISNKKLLIVFFACLLCQISFINLSFAQKRADISSYNSLGEMEKAIKNGENINNPYEDKSAYNSRDPNRKKYEQKIKNSSDNDINNLSSETQSDLDKAQLEYEMEYGRRVLKPKSGNYTLTPEEKALRNKLLEENRIEVAKSYGVSDEVLGLKEPCSSPKDLKEKYLTKKCLYCPLFDTIFEAVSKITQRAFNNIAPSALILLTIGMALWITKVTILFIATIDKRDPKDYIQGLIVQSFKVLIAAILLKSTASTIFNLIIEPIFITGLKVPGIAFNSNCNEIISNSNINTYATSTEGALPVEMGLYIDCLVRQVEEKLMDTLVIGSTISCIGWEYEKMVIAPAWMFFAPDIPHFGIILNGLIIFSVGAILLIAFPFYMIDVVVKLGIGGAVLPLAIAGWPFKMTSQYAKKIFNIYLECMFSFLFLGIVIFVILEMLQTALNGGSSDGINLAKAMTDENYVQTFIGLFSWSGINLLNLLFILILSKAIIGEMKYFAKSFCEEIGNSNLGAQVGGRFASVISSGTGKLTKPLREYGSEKAKKGWDNTTNALNQSIKSQSLNRAAQKAARNGNILSANNQFGGATYQTKKNNSLILTQTSSSGNVLQTSTKTNSSGTEIKTATDKYLSIKTRTDKNGNVVRQEISFTNSNILNKDGTINTTIVNDMLKNSMHDPKQLKQALAQQIAKKQLGIENDKFDYTANSFTETKDENGNTILSIKKGFGDSSMTYNITFGSGNRVMCEEKTLHSDGRSRVRKTDGIFKQIFETNKDGSIDNDSYSFGFSEKLNMKTSNPINSFGEFHNSIPVSDSMFSKDEIDENKMGIYKQSQK